MELQDSGETAGPANRTDGTTRGGRRVGRVRRDESGLVLVWTALFLMVLLGFAALAVDLGHSYYVGQKEQNAADAAALAGAPYLPGDVPSAQAAARQIAATNGFTDGTDGVSVSAVQDPGNPSQLLVTVHQTLSTWFGAAIGFRSMDVSKTATGIASETSTTKPVDMVLILDRTQSMNAQDLQAVKDASGALLETLDPGTDSVALGVTGPSLTTKQCGNGAYGLGPPTIATDPSMTWIAAPWPNTAPVTDYQNPDGTLNTSSQIVKTINCLNTSQSNTNLGDPLTAAKNYLATYGRVGAEKDIILMTDGAANKPDGTQPCEYANDAATSVKNAGITIVTIGFGLDDPNDVQNHCRYDTDAGDPFKNAFATKPLAAMASPINGVAATDDQGCTDAENTDGDNFYCLPKDSGDLSSVFVKAAASLTSTGPRLVK